LSRRKHQVFATSTRRTHCSFLLEGAFVRLDSLHEPCTKLRSLSGKRKYGNMTRNAAFATMTNNNNG